MAKQLKTTTQRGYGHRWQLVRRRALRRDKGLCVDCLAVGRYTIAHEVDHITRKADGGSDDIDNLQSLCTKHHEGKTRAENSKGVSSSCGSDGIPTDSRHHWRMG